MEPQTERIVHAFDADSMPCGDVVMTWLVHSSLDQAVWVQALTGYIALCSWARHFILTVSLSTQLYKS